jgi:hypothetical protein
MNSPDAVEAKIRENAEKYPVKQSKGSATKHLRREQV